VVVGVSVVLVVVGLAVVFVVLVTVVLVGFVVPAPGRVVGGLVPVVGSGLDAAKLRVSSSRPL
jgi:hypothetical protein